MKTRTSAASAIILPGPITMGAGLDLYNVLDDELADPALDWAELAALGIRESLPRETWA